MFLGPYEYTHEHASRDEVGSIEINTQYVTRRKPVWLVLLKLLGVALFVAVAVGIAYPCLQAALSPLQAAAAIAGFILIYCGLAFFVHPEANTDNLGYCGGGMNDPTKLSDDYNRGLLELDHALGPGRFAVETLLDVCVLLGLARGEEVIEDHVATEDPVATMQLEMVTLKASRFEE